MSSVSQFYATSIEALQKQHSLILCTENNLNVKLKMLKNAFCNVSTEYRFFNLLEEKNCLIKPVSVIINFQLQPRRVRNKKTSVNQSYKIETIPMKLVLKRFLELQNVYQFIIDFMNNPRKGPSLMLQSELWKQIASDFKDKLVLPLSIYFDDYEINNPLGTHRGRHKMRAVYYNISSIPSEFCSKLNKIFLAQIHKEKDYAQLGNKKVFNNFINELQELRNNGVTININGEKKKIYFAVLKILGDNLGLNSLLEFQKSFNSNFFCRICRADKSMTQNLTIEDESLLRTE